MPTKLRGVTIVIMVLLFVTTFFSDNIIKTTAWSNGGYSADPNNPDYGTHDWIAEHALGWLPAEEKQYITNNLSAYLYGTELPDNPNPPDGIGDTTNHHVYYYSSGDLQDNVGALRPQTEFNNALNYLRNNDNDSASKNAGILTHYIADLSVFGHVMGSSTDWGTETHHSDYENYVNDRTGSYTSPEFDPYLSFDGSLENITAYDAGLYVAYNTTFGDGSVQRNCTWMDDNYDWSDPVFKDSCGAALNRAVNIIADVLHTLYWENKTGSPPAYGQSILFSEIYYDTTGTDSLEEYIELYNPSNVSVDINSWTIEDNAATYLIIESMKIPPHSYYTIARDSDTFYTTYGVYPDKGDLTLGLNNNGDQLWLNDSTGDNIDFVAWEGGDAGSFPLWGVSASTGFTIRRIPVYRDTNTSSDWVGDQSQDPQVQLNGSFFSIQLKVGWNLISIPVVPANKSLVSVLKSIEGNYTSVFQYYLFDSIDPWKLYNRNKPFGNDLVEINHTMGLWVDMIDPDILELNGTYLYSISVPLKAGWNLVGYPSFMNKSLDNAFVGVPYDLIK